MNIKFSICEGSEIYSRKIPVEKSMHAMLRLIEKDCIKIAAMKKQKCRSELIDVFYRGRVLQHQKDVTVQNFFQQQQPVLRVVIHKPQKQVLDPFEMFQEFMQMIE